MADRKQNWLVPWLVVLTLMVWLLVSQWYQIQDDKQSEHESLRQEIEELKERLPDEP